MGLRFHSTNSQTVQPKKWAEQNNRDKTKVNSTFNGSQPLQIIRDLSNDDKHGYPPRKGGHSGKSPGIDKVTPFMQMTVPPSTSMRLTFDFSGKLQVAGSGTAKIIITADILDSNDKKIGELHNIASQALDAWEKLLNDFGIQV